MNIGVKRQAIAICTEADEQITVIEWCRLHKYPYDRIYAIENERKTNGRQGSKRVAMGVKAGVPDLFLPIARNGYNGLYIEMKSKKGKVSKMQKKFIDEVSKEGYLAIVCYGADEAIAALKNYCGGK